MSNIIKYGIAVVVGFFLGVAIALLFSGGGGAGGATNFDSLELGGTLTVTGATTLTGAVTQTGAATLSSTLDVAGATKVDEFTQGGSVLSSSTPATATVIGVGDLLTYSTWVITPIVADITYTFPASSTLSTIIPSVGDSRTWTIVNASTTAAIDVIFAAGTGSAIKAAGAGALTLDEDSHGEITLSRLPDGDGNVGDIKILVKFPDAD